MSKEQGSILTVDIGTSSVRVATFEADGSMQGLTQVKYPTLRPRPFMEEQDPDLVLAKVHETIGACLSSLGSKVGNIRGIVFSSQMYGVFPIDGDGKPLTNNILWSDGRAEEEAENIRESGPYEELYRQTGCPVNSIYPLAKILWLKNHCPEIHARAVRFVSIKEYVLETLISEWVIDYSMASGTGMFDVVAQKWSELALETAGITHDQVSRPVPGDLALAFRNQALRKAWTLPAECQVFSSGGDGPLANLGSGASAVGKVNIDLGTSGAARVVLDRPAFDSEGRLWCYCITPGRWAFGGILSNVGNAWHWLASSVTVFGNAEAVDREIENLGKLAAEVGPGSEGVFFLPYLRKARAPSWDGRLRGSVFGLCADHDVRHLARAMLEAIAFDLAEILDIAAGHTALCSSIILTGGLSKSGIVPQLLADVTGKDVVVPDHSEGSLAGAAIVGLKGAGMIDGFAFQGQSEGKGKRYVPSPSTHAFYQTLRKDYASLIDVVRNIPFYGRKP